MPDHERYTLEQIRETLAQRGVAVDVHTDLWVVAETDLDLQEWDSATVSKAGRDKLITHFEGGAERP